MCDDAIDAGNKTLTKRCMGFADVVVRYGSLPLQSVNVFVSMLCRTVNIESHGSWKIMRNLLSGNLGYTCRQAMLVMLEGTRNRILEPSTRLRSDKVADAPQAEEIHSLSPKKLFAADVARDRAGPTRSLRSSSVPNVPVACQIELRVAQGEAQARANYPSKYFFAFQSV